MVHGVELESGLLPLELLRMVWKSRGQYFDPQNVIVQYMKDHSCGTIIISKMICVGRGRLCG